MTPYERYHIAESETASESMRAIVAALILIALFAGFAYVAPRDPTKVGSIPCDVVSEQQVSQVVGTTMRLMPTSGSVCHYVATAGNEASSVFVVARAESNLPAARANDIRLSGIGEAALLTPDALYVRSHARSYKLIVTPQTSNNSAGSGQLLRLAAMLGDRTMARNR